MSGIHVRVQSDVARSDFEFECVREFSHSGVQLGANVSREERRARIRAAIMRENKQNRRWRDTSLTYAALYQQVYGKPIEARRADEEEIAPMRALRTQLWDYDASTEDVELDHVSVDDSL
jgi:hypothetical protein